MLADVSQATSCGRAGADHPKARLGLGSARKGSPAKDEPPVEIRRREDVTVADGKQENLAERKHKCRGAPSRGSPLGRPTAADGLVGCC